MAEERRLRLSLRKRWGGLFRRPSGVLRKIVKRHAILALQDLCYLLIFVLVFLTGIRTLPLLQELWQHGSVSVTSPGPRRILLKHLKGTGRDMKRFGKFFVLSSFVFLLGVGVPSYLRKLPGRLRSLEDATRCAEEHLQDTLKYLCELLLLFTAWRTYKLIVTASLYAILVPPACLAEALPRALTSVQGRFMIGVTVWIGLVVGAFLLTFGVDSSSSEHSVRTSFLALFGTLIAVVALSTLSLQTRSIFRSPIDDSTTGTTLILSHFNRRLLFLIYFC